MNDKTLYLHIGQDKAGSTAIQQFLFQNHALIKERGYDITGGHQQHHGYVHLPFMKGDYKAFEGACEYLRDSAYRNHIMSFEGFYHLREDNLKHFLSGLSDFRIIVIFYVRRRSDKFRSGFAQHMKLKNLEQNAKKATMLMNDELNRLIPENSKNLDYLSIVRRWQNGLTELRTDNDFKLRVYERSSLSEGDLLTDFGRTIGLFNEEETPASESFLMPPANTNPSLSPAAQYLNLSVLSNLNPKEHEKFRQLLMSSDNAHEQKHSLIPDKIAKKLDKIYLDSDKVLAQEFFGRSKLFKEPAKFRYARPDGGSFINLINKMAIKNNIFE